MQIKKKAPASTDILFGGPAPQVEYVAPPKIDEELVKKTEEALTPAVALKKLHMRGRCSYCGAWEHSVSWGDDCRNFRVEYPDPIAHPEMYDEGYADSLRPFMRL